MSSRSNVPMGQDAGIKTFHHGRALWVGLTIIALVAIGAVFWTLWGIETRESEFETALEKRLELLASSRADLIGKIVEIRLADGKRIIHSDLFRLYAAEVALLEQDISLLVTGAGEGGKEGREDLPMLAAQLPMMQTLLTEFIRYTDYLAGRIINRTGHAYMATDGSTTPLTPVQQHYFQKALEAGKPVFAPLRHTSKGLVLDFFLPIFPPEATGEADRPVAALFLAKAISDRISELLSSVPHMGEGERTRLMQQAEAGFEEIVPWLPGGVARIGQDLSWTAEGSLPFAVRKSLRGEKKVYSVAVQIPVLKWWVVQEADYDLVRAGHQRQNMIIAGVAGLVILLFAITFGAVWLGLTRYEKRRVAEHFEHLAARIEEKRQLLDSINGTVTDFIGLKDLSGHYRYINPAFASAVGREPEEAVGLDDEAIFGFDTAKRLEHSDQQVTLYKEAVSFHEHLYLQSRSRHLKISKIPFMDAEGSLAGIVSVMDDITELVEAQQLHERTIRQTVEALVRAIELTDPYLAGHSRLMQAFSVEVATLLGAAEAEVATVETAANLSQVGKMFIDRELLHKTGALEEGEKRELERHVEHSADVLRDVHFGLPVYDAVYQMNEHLDGSGYPQRLRGEEIGLPARILAVVNSFCAMVEPRAYRSARTVEEALSILEQATDHYDDQVVRGLGEVVHSAVGEKVLAGRAEIKE